MGSETRVRTCFFFGASSVLIAGCRVWQVGTDGVECVDTIEIGTVRIVGNVRRALWIGYQYRASLGLAFFSRAGSRIPESFNNTTTQVSGSWLRHPSSQTLNLYHSQVAASKTFRLLPLPSLHLNGF